MAFNQVEDPSTIDGLPELLQSYDEKGAPDPNLFMALGQRPEIAQTFSEHWDATFFDGVVDHNLKELVRLHLSTLNGCNYCGSIGSNLAAEQGLSDEKAGALDDFETDSRFSERERVALRFAEAFHENEHDYEVLADQFSEEEIIELVWFMGLCDGLGRVVAKTDLSACRIPVEELH